MQRHPNALCDNCQNPFYCKPSVRSRSKSGKVFCSMACYGASCQKPRPCVICGTRILSSRNALTCSHACANTHRTGIKYKIGRPSKSKVATARLIRQRLIETRGEPKCRRCGYEEYPEVVQVHHIIERKNGGTDELTNLEFLCPTCHAVEHHLRRTNRTSAPEPFRKRIGP